MVTDDQRLGGLLDRLLDRRLDDVLHPLAGVGALGEQQTGLEVDSAGGMEVLGDQQRLDAGLVEPVTRGSRGRVA